MCSPFDIPLFYSFWGKFGERENKPQTITIQKESDWYRIIQDEPIIVKDVRIFNEDAMEVTIVRKEGACEPSLKVNIFTAAFTTTLARLKLYESLEKLDQQVLYYDADSVVYKWAPGLPDIPTGLYLGEMTDELEGDSITLFGSAGPISYYYATKSGDKECKNKGTKSSDKINQNLNCDSMINHIKLEL